MHSPSRSERQGASQRIREYEAHMRQTGLGLAVIAMQTKPRNSGDVASAPRANGGAPSTLMMGLSWRQRLGE
jgi:hypothetical protein